MDGPGHRRKIYLHVAPFEKENFAEYVSPRASRKLHIQYLAEYLCKIGAKTIIIEKPYYDRHIFRDHWALSADSASGEEYDCARMHFFKKAMDSPQNKRKISLEELSDFIRQSRQEEGEDKGYLGFIVIVLKSEQMIGTTCLAPPPQLSTTIDYPANLVGHSLSIKSLAFREQDKVTSACATCALWSTLQKTSREFGHEELSPGEITARALKLHSRKESLPMDMGLSNEDIASAINSISGLRVMTMNLKYQARERFEQSREDSGGGITRTELGRLGSISVMLDFIVPLLDHGVPVILIMESVGERPSRARQSIVHAVSIVGYETTANEKAETKIDEISELIVHDDNVGPFTRLQLEEGSNHLRCKDRNELESKDSAREPHSVIGICHDSIKPEPFLASGYCIELYHRILDELKKEERFRDLLRSVGIEKVRVWEKRICASNDYKEELIGIKEDIGDINDLSENEKKLHKFMKKFLLRPLPDYILVLSIKGPIAHDLVFSMAGPWQIEFIQIVPHKLETLKLLALVKEAAETLLKEEIMWSNYTLPIIEQIKQYSWS